MTDSPLHDSETEGVWDWERGGRQEERSKNMTKVQCVIETKMSPTDCCNIQPKYNQYTIVFMVNHGKLTVIFAGENVPHTHTENK